MRLLSLFTLLLCATSTAQTLRWRSIGPYRAGRVTTVAGVPGQPDVYYFGTPGGGIWKTSSGGQVWKPIFDATGVGSIGAIAVAASDPNILYAGTGDRQPGRGVFRSNDAGATWAPAGLANARFIASLLVDPRNPDHVIAGVNSLGYSILWRPVPRNAFTVDRGVFQTLDGGRTWTRVLSRDDTAGVVDLCADPANPNTLYATLFRPGSGKGDAEIGATSDLYRSTDGGSTWAPLPSQGLPEKKRGRAGIAAAGPRLYAILSQGVYRSDDAGEHWTQSTKDPRVIGDNYFSRVFIDPANSEILYVVQTSMYRSTDGGRTFDPFAGAPSGDDYHVLWIDPRNSRRMIAGVDQGAVVTVDGGQTWSSWYNQPTGEFYHVTTDQQFPYRVYGAQQDSGTVGILSRGDFGQIMAQDWSPIGGFEYAQIAPDPAHPNLVYSQGWYGSVVRWDRTTGMVATIFDKGTEYRAAGIVPLLFSPQDPKVLYIGMQYLLKTADAGLTWQRKGPDLTGFVKPAVEDTDPDAPPNPAISTLAASRIKAGVIWAGTTNRIVQLTEDGGDHWKNVTPPNVPDHLRISTVEAGRHDARTAYVAAGDFRWRAAGAFAVRTHDSGKTWESIVNGIPPEDSVEVVREDPVRAKLLYAGTTSGVFVSHDDGGHWQPLRFNLPHVLVTDLDVHGDDLVAATFGRAFWILDGLAPLRESPVDTRLLPPATAIRARWDNNQDTPYPLETPAGENPPNGAILDYFLKTAASGEATLTISDTKGNPVRSFSTADRAPELPLPNVPGYWFGPGQPLPAANGWNRFVWDLRVAPPKSLPYSYYGDLLEYTEYTLADHAIPGSTPRQQPLGPLVPPGRYTLALSVNGQTYRQTLTIRPDPRISVAQADLDEQWALAQKVLQAMETSYRTYYEAVALQKKSTDDAAKKALDAIIKGTTAAPGVGPVNRDLTRIISALAFGDVRPSNTVREAVDGRLKALDERLAAWRKLAN